MGITSGRILNRVSGAPSGMEINEPNFSGAARRVMPAPTIFSVCLISNSSASVNGCANTPSRASGCPTTPGENRFGMSQIAKVRQNPLPARVANASNNTRLRISLISRDRLERPNRCHCRREKLGSGIVRVKKRPVTVCGGHEFAPRSNAHGLVVPVLGIRILCGLEQVKYDVPDRIPPRHNLLYRADLRLSP